MKTLRIIFFAVFFVGFLIPHASAQKQVVKKDFRFTVKTNPLAALGGPFWVTIIPITGEYKINFEVATTKKQSFQLGASYLGPSVLINLEEISSSSEEEVGGVKINGFRLQGTYKFFVTRNTTSPEGFYVGPYISYASMKMENKDFTEDNVSGKKITYDAVLGYQLITEGGFTMDVFTGFGLRTLKWDYEDEDVTTFEVFKSKNAGHVALGFSFGFAF